jgi:hypothetical protein
LVQEGWQAALRHYGVLLLAMSQRGGGAPSAPPQLPPFADPALLRDTALASLSMLLEGGPELRPGPRTARLLMGAALDANDAATAIDVFTSVAAFGAAPDVAVVNLMLCALARRGEWLQTWHVLQSAWRGVGVDAESVKIVRDLLDMVCMVAAEHEAGLRQQVHELMDQVRLCFWRCQRSECQGCIELGSSVEPGAGPMVGGRAAWRRSAWHVFALACTIASPASGG